MNTLLSEDHGFKGMLKASIQELFANSRKRLRPSFFPVLQVMEKVKPSQYKGGNKLGDTLECLHDILNTLIDDETQSWIRRGRSRLTDYENLQNSSIFKTFGFRTL